MKIFVFAVLLGLLFNAQMHGADLSKLTVTGNAVISKPADQLNMMIGVITQDLQVEQALNANKERMAKVLDALKTLGLQEQEYHTGGFTVVPQYAPTPKNPPPDWSPKLMGYEVRNTLTIKTDKITLIGKVIDGVGKVGANLIKDISFTLHDSESAQKEAIAQAIRQGRAFAEAAAKEAQISLGSTRNLIVNPAYIQPRFMNMSKMALAAPESVTTIVPGDVDVSASVSIEYEIMK